MKNKNSMHCIEFHRIIKSLLIWALIIPLAIANGFLRDVVMTSFMGKYALPASGITLCVMIFALCWFLVPRLGRSNTKTYIIMGMFWAALAVAFECAMGIFILGASWTELGAAYDLSTGNFWLLVLVSIGCSPWITAKMHSRRAAKSSSEANINHSDSPDGAKKRTGYGF